MALVNGPLFSFDARGSIGKLMTYQKTRAGLMVRRWVDTSHSPSENQAVIRYWVGRAVDAWQSMTGEEKEVYNGIAEHQKFTGYNYFVSEYVKEKLAVGEGYEFAILGRAILGRMRLGRKE